MTPAPDLAPDLAPDPAATPACPICGEPARADVRPFCSARHRDRDLLQWLGEGYRLPGGPATDADGDGGLDKRGPAD